LAPYRSEVHFISALAKHSIGVPVSLFFTFAATRRREARRLVQETLALQPGWSPALVEGLPAAPELQKAPPHHDVKTVWEFRSSVEPEEWHPLDHQNGEVDDDTRAFTLDGPVAIKLSAAMVKARLSNSAEELFYLRCRFASGAYDATPRLKNIALNACESNKPWLPAR
jgi:hypothetical protein